MWRHLEAATIVWPKCLETDTTKTEKTRDRNGSDRNSSDWNAQTEMVRPNRPDRNDQTEKICPEHGSSVTVYSLLYAFSECNE